MDSVGLSRVCPLARRSEKELKLSAACANEITLTAADLSARASHIRVDIESLPEMIDALRSGHSPNIEQNADIRLQDLPKRIEKPPMRVDLLLVSLFEAEEDLYGHDALFPPSEAELWIY